MKAGGAATVHLLRFWMAKPFAKTYCGQKVRRAVVTREAAIANCHACAMAKQGADIVATAEVKRA